MKKDPDVLLEHILESIERIEMYLHGKTQDNFLNAIDVQDSVLYRLAVIGEASNAVPKNIQDSYSDIRWRDIVGLRNIVIHEYFGVSLQEVWDTVQNDLPVFKKQVEAILSGISKEK